uniref:PIN domain-containing protein n=1 Tax=Thermosphaera aggregans TaxID=54254 RepID=A0A7C2FXR5_9CREN
MKIAYLDTSAIVKRYIQEVGSDIVASVYSNAWQGEAKISFSLWNIGEVLGVLDKYYRRGWLTGEDFKLARREFIGETLRMLKLRILRIVPVKPSIVVKSWRLVEKYHVYQADAIQIASSKEVKAEEFYTGDKTLCSIAELEGLKQVCLG